MQKNATSARLEDIELERDFEDSFGREMTREEKRMFALSAHLLDPAPEDVKNHVERRSNLRIMPSPSRKKVA
jgi:hypothetical protein